MNLLYLVECSNAWKKFVAEAAGSSNGRTSPSGGEYLGSSPSPAASVGNKFATLLSSLAELIYRL